MNNLTTRKIVLGLSDDAAFWRSACWGMRIADFPLDNGTSGDLQTVTAGQSDVDADLRFSVTPH